MDYKAVQLQAEQQLIDAGIEVRLARDGVALCKFFGVFATSNMNDLDARKFTPISGTTSVSKILLAPGSMKKVPAIGDTLTCSHGVFTVTVIEVVRPAKLTILYKLTVK
jgi:hypothetical protein